MVENVSLSVPVLPPALLTSSRQARWSVVDELDAPFVNEFCHRDLGSGFPLLSETSKEYSIGIAVVDHTVVRQDDF